VGDKRQVKSNSKKEDKKPRQSAKETVPPQPTPAPAILDNTGRLTAPSDLQTGSQLRPAAILQMQRTYGNAFVQRLVARRRDKLAAKSTETTREVNGMTRLGTPTGTPLIMRQDLLSDDEKAAAIRYHTRRYDRRSTQIIQITSGGVVSGTFDAASTEAVARYQDANGLDLVDGKVGPETLNSMVPNRAANRRHEHAVQLVADFHNVDRSDVLTMRHDTTLAAGVLQSVTFESGNLRVVKLGTGAFTSGDTLRDAIRAAMAVPVPEGPDVGERPEHLTREQEEAATAYNRAQYSDRRSIAGIQGVVGTGYDRIFGPDTAERIAEFQNTNGLTVNGMVNEETLEAMVAHLDVTGGQNAAIRMIMDFFNMSDYGALLDISYDPAVASNATTGGDIPGPSIVKIGRPPFDREFAALVHTIAHELEHVRQRNEGILRQPIREFLGEAIEIVSEGMPDETLAGFMSDARRAYSFWRAMTDDERREYWARFEEVREQIRNRYAAASAAEQTTHQGTMDNYNAETEPAP
jgi:peptidoglycan hydrolase-like protein with peptidoglycan-binding domain